MLYTNEEYKYLKRKGIDPDSFRNTYKMLKEIFGSGVFISSARVTHGKKD